MRADWNQRAGEDAYYYVAFGRRGQDDEEFFATARDVTTTLELDLKRLKERGAALEIGCGPGRLMRPMASHFKEIHGVDVSDEMIARARENLKDLPNAHVYHGSGADLSMFDGPKFDFVYSYAVFQHIPSREVVFNYLREARRVLKPGGILRCQLNGLPPHASQYDTWSGVRVTEDEIRRFAIVEDMQLLVIEQVWTQYMWITARKRIPGWTAALPHFRPRVLPSFERVSNALTGEGVAPVRGPLAALSLWIKNLPEAFDLIHMTVTAAGLPCHVMYIGEPDRHGVSQVNVALPSGLRTGLVPVELLWLGSRVAIPAWVRIIPAGPSVPRIYSVADGVSLLSGTRIVTGTVKVTMFELADPTVFRVNIDGRDAKETESFCADPVSQRYEFNFKLPEGIGRGPHRLEVRLGKIILPSVEIEVA
jgi:SAM-dependent methyltransferase